MSDPGNRTAASLDIEVRQLIERLGVSERDRRELLRAITSRRREINELVRRAERAEKRLRGFAVEDSIVELLCRGLPQKEIAARLGCTDPYVSTVLKRTRERFTKMLAVEGGPNLAMQRGVKVRSQLFAIARGEDPFADATSTRGATSLISRLDRYSSDDQAQEGHEAPRADGRKITQTICGVELSLDLDALLDNDTETDEVSEYTRL